MASYITLKEIVSWISHLLSDQVRSAIGSAIMSLTLRHLLGNKWFVHMLRTLVSFFFSYPHQENREVNCGLPAGGQGHVGTHLAKLQLLRASQG